MPLSYWERKMLLRLESIAHQVNAANMFDMYVQGIIDGIEAHAIHKDGQLLCGAMQRPFQEVKQEILTAARKYGV